MLDSLPKTAAKVLITYRTVDNNVMSLTRTRVALDTRGRWSDEYAATEWAFQYLFPVCNDTDQMVAIQVSCSSLHDWLLVTMSPSTYIACKS